MWNDERIAELKRRWSGGESASQIALAMGAPSRNSIIGKAHRLGLGQRAPLRKPRKAKKAPPAVKIEVLAPVPQKPAPVAPAAPYVPVARISHAELKPHHCQMPVGDPKQPGFGFCGQPRKIGKAYCPDCCGVAHVKPEPRSRAPKTASSERTISDRAFKGAFDFLRT